MTSERSPTDQNSIQIKNNELSQRLDIVGWAIFMIWVGIAFLADVGWGWGLLGIGIIILGETVIRSYLKLSIGGIWVVVGILFLTGGLWELYQVPWPLVPILIIGCGLVMLWGAISGKNVMKK